MPLVKCFTCDCLSLEDACPAYPSVSQFPFFGERPICSGWIAAAKAGGVESVEIAPAMGFLLSVKDINELENVKKAAILTNKVSYWMKWYSGVEGYGIAEYPFCRTGTEFSVGCDALQGVSGYIYKIVMRRR